MKHDERDSWIDYQLCSDGSNRWLWQVIHRGLLWRAGVQHLYEDARRSAHRAWGDLLEALGPIHSQDLRTVQQMAAGDDDPDAEDEPIPPPPAA